MSVGLSCDTLELKNRFVKQDGSVIIDLTQATLTDMGSVTSSDYVIVPDSFAARPDKVATAKYGDHNKFDYICKYNAISNPLSLRDGQTLFIPDEEQMRKAFSTPKELKNVSNTEDDKSGNTNNADFNTPKTSADKARAEYLKKKFNLNELTPPNINKDGEENVTFVDGKIVLGNSVSNKDTACPEQFTRARLKQQLLSKNMFK